VTGEADEALLAGAIAMAWTAIDIAERADQGPPPSPWRGAGRLSTAR
jgi:hypothetical protein